MNNRTYFVFLISTLFAGAVFFAAVGIAEGDIVAAILALLVSGYGGNRFFEEISELSRIQGYYRERLSFLNDVERTMQENGKGFFDARRILDDLKAAENEVDENGY